MEGENLHCQKGCKVAGTHTYTRIHSHLHLHLHTHTRTTGARSSSSASPSTSPLSALPGPAGPPCALAPHPRVHVEHFHHAPRSVRREVGVGQLGQTAASGVVGASQQEPKCSQQQQVETVPGLSLGGRLGEGLVWELTGRRRERTSCCCRRKR